MGALKIIGYIAAAILILFGILFVLGAGGAGGGGWSWVLIGGLLVLFGFGLIFLASRQKPAGTTQNVTLKIDLPGNVNMDSLKCQSCGGALTSENIKMVQGAPMVTCPFCNSVYQITEEPKW